LSYVEIIKDKLFLINEYKQLIPGKFMFYLSNFPAAILFPAGPFAKTVIQNLMTLHQNILSKFYKLYIILRKFTQGQAMRYNLSKCWLGRVNEAFFNHWRGWLHWIKFHSLFDQ